MSKIDGVNAEPVVASLKTMNYRTSTSGRDVTKVGVVNQASIGTSKMDHGMESNDGQMMDQEWILCSLVQ